MGAVVTKCDKQTKIGTPAVLVICLLGLSDITDKSLKHHFWSHQNRKYHAIFAIVGGPKIAFPVPETKIRDHF